MTAPRTATAIARNPEPPVEIRLSADRSQLTLVWEDGRVDALPAPRLRAQARSAGTRRLRIAGLDAPVPADMTLAAVRLLGAYGLNLAFSDGHDRAIYPWALLKEIAQSPDFSSETAAPPANAIP